MRKVLSAAKCSQMSNPGTGTGSGGDRCTEACGAIVDATYQVSSLAKSGASPETIMFRFTESLNGGSDSSVPENFNWFTNWLKSQTHGQMYATDVVWPSFNDVIACIDRGHIAVGGFDDYVNLRLANGQKPWPWNDPHGLGHVLVIVGYDTSAQTVIVHDPLRADPSGQPADYSWVGFQAAGFHDLIEIVGVPLAPGTGSIGGPGGYSGAPGSLASRWLQALAAFIVAALQWLIGYFAQPRLT